jgi:hypothetical protein
VRTTGYKHACLRIQLILLRLKVRRSKGIERFMRGGRDAVVVARGKIVLTSIVASVKARLSDDALHFHHAVLGIDDRMTTRGIGGQIDEIAEDTVAEGVMGNLMHALVLIGRHADDVKYH